METGRKKPQRSESRTYSIQAFIRRVVMTLIALVVASAIIILLLVYLPLRVELEKSLMDNFYQLSFIRYTSLQSNIDRGLEGARSLSSRTVIRNLILEYENGAMDMEGLIEATQSRYEDGTRALEYLIRAERVVDHTVIARYLSDNYKDHSCETDSRLVQGEGVSSALCVTDSHAYFVVLSPLLAQGRVLGYDKLVFDLSGQIRMLCNSIIQSEIMYRDEFEAFSAQAKLVQSNGTSSLIYKEDFYYQAFHMQDNTYFISRQSADSLLDPVNRLSKQTLLTGISVLLGFTTAVYFAVIRFAQHELVYLEDSRRSLKAAVSEANLDPLTGAGNRRFGEEFLVSAFESFQNGEASPAILLFDIDSLKRINDTYGHSVGDRVIHSIAKTVRESIRSGDMLLRWGGDEFIGIFGGFSIESTIPFAQKLLKSVSSLSIETDAEPINPTISIGVSYFHQEDISFIDAINRADRAMYQSKSAGRNRVHLL